jgi:dienelactone hydrolase
VCFRLAAGEFEGLADCVIAGHPSLLTKEDIDNARAPVQIQAPEFDEAYPAELKEHTWKTLQKNGVTFDYQHFPGVEHSCLVRGSPKIAKERDAMARGKNAAVAWFRQWLKTE